MRAPGKLAMMVGMSARTPTFCVVLRDGENWVVEAEWPDGTIAAGADGCSRFELGSTSREMMSRPF